MKLCSLTCSSIAYLQLCGTVPNRPRMVLVCRLGGPLALLFSVYLSLSLLSSLSPPPLFFKLTWPLVVSIHCFSFSPLILWIFLPTVPWPLLLFFFYLAEGNKRKINYFQISSTMISKCLKEGGNENEEKINSSSILKEGIKEHSDILNIGF